MFPYPTRSDHAGPAWVGDDIMSMSYEDPAAPIYLVISSEGGDISTGFALFDVIKSSPAPVITISMSSMSMGTVVAMAGDERWIFPHSRLMLHLPRATISGDTEDIKIRSKLVSDILSEISDVYLDRGVTAGFAAKSKKEIRKQLLKDINREKWFNAQEALDYGLIDKIIGPGDMYGGLTCKKI